MDTFGTAAKTSEEDEVVFEADVYLSKALADNLYLFHYPTRNAVLSDDDIECLSAKIKPKQQKVELEIGIDTHSSTYDESRGEQIAFNVDGQNPTGDAFFRSSLMDRYMLSGTKAGVSAESYALGFLKKGELHITPLQAIVELRPGFAHMDKMDVQSKKEQNVDEEEEAEAVAVTVRFEGPNAEKDRQIRQKSYQFMQQKYANEPWIDVNYHQIGSAPSKVECEKLLCSQTRKDVTSDRISSQDYLKELVPECLRLSGYESGRDEDTAVLLNKPLSDQLKHLMINAHVLKFSTLLEKLPPNLDCVNVERLIQQTAVLVQGCWVVKSDVLYDENSVSPLTGLASKMLINARDYLVWQFTKSRFITRQEVLSAIYVPDDDFKSIINPIAVKSNRGWEFKYPFDKEFVDSHPAIEQSQEIKWNLRYKKLVTELSLGMSDSEVGDSHKVPSSAVLHPKLKRHSRSSLSEEGEESGTDSITVSKDSKPKRTYNTKKRSAISPSKYGTKPKYQIATLDVSPTFLETSPSEDLKAELRDCVGDAIRTQFCMTLSDLKELVSESPLSAVINRSDFEELLEEALLACGAQKVKNKWPQNTLPEPLYVFTKFGNKLDRYRNCLLDLFSTTARSRTNFFVKKVEDDLREIISEADCRQIFDDYCIYKSGFYYLKGTVSLDS